MPELSDQEIERLQYVDKLMKKLAGPKTKFQFEDLIKQVEPSAATTKDDLAPALMAVDEVKESVKKIEERFKKMDDDQADSKFFAAMADLKDNHGLTEEGAEKLKQIMRDKIIPDPYVAFNHMRAIEPKEKAPSTFSPMSWGFRPTSDDKNVSELFKDEDSWAEREAYAAWNEAGGR